MEQYKIDRYNSIVLEKLSFFLNFKADSIKKDIMDILVNEYNLKKEEAFSILFAEECGFDIENNSEHMEIYEKYFQNMIHQLNVEEYKSNLYYKNIQIPDTKTDRWKFKNEYYKPYEAFVFNDLKQEDDGRIIPQIGFFDTEFFYPAVLENDREWMLITPNEIETMKEPVNEAYGKVLTYGLGLGYYAYMVSMKKNVSSVTIIEKDEKVIKLFKEYILPKFNYAEKITIIHDDAFNYAENHMKEQNYDFIFTDIWHDPSDGIDLYLKMKEYEKLNPNSKFMYWIEKTMMCYLE